MTKLPLTVQLKAPGLLPMLYKVSELAEELGLLEPTLRSWLANGAPHERDARGHIWINGETFAKWVSVQSRPKPTQRLTDNEGFCFRCKAVVPLKDPQIIPGKGKQIYIRGACEVCGATINRGGCRGKSV